MQNIWNYGEKLWEVRKITTSYKDKLMEESKLVN